MRNAYKSAILILVGVASCGAEPIVTTYVDLGPREPDMNVNLRLTKVRFAMTIQNTDSKPLRVITGGLLYCGKWQTKNRVTSCEVVFARSPQSTPKSEPIIVSESELKIVALLQHECAQIEGEVEIPYPIEAKNISAKYLVHESFGRRFDVWTGEIKTPVIRLGGTKMPNKSPEPTPAAVTPRANERKAK